MELLVVVLIIGILAAVALPQYQYAVYKSKYTKNIALLTNLAAEMKVYYLANGQFPADWDALQWSGFSHCKQLIGNYCYLEGNKIIFRLWGNCARMDFDGGIIYYNYLTDIKKCQARVENANSNRLCSGLGPLVQKDVGGYNMYQY